MRHFLLLAIVFFAMHTAHAQFTITDIPAAFNTIHTTPQTIKIKRSNIKIPSGGHFQGIQALSDSQFVITGSSSSYAYYITTDRKTTTSIQKLTDAPFRHAGGCQLMGTMLFVGVEDNVAKDKSQIMIAGHIYPDSTPFSYPIISRSGIFKRSTAGAVGITSALRGYLMAVADWDSKNIDFYLCSDGNPKHFDSLTTFHAPDDHHWPSYQNINLLSAVGGKIYLIGMGLDGISNRADLYEVDIDRYHVSMKLISTRYFSCRGHAGFRYASGIDISPDHKLIIYTLGMHLSSPINVFR